MPAQEFTWHVHMRRRLRKLPPISRRPSGSRLMPLPCGSRTCRPRPSSAPSTASSTRSPAPFSGKDFHGRRLYWRKRLQPGPAGPAGCAALLRLSADQIANAFGIAGSLSGGLLAFAKAGSGGMIKRLHLGRAAEGGVLAARLAQRGYEGPRTVLEGRYGVLDAFCEE